jgi:hypothetical protein
MASVNTFRAFKGFSGEPDGFGLAAVERARLAGFSDAEIIAGVEAEGLKLGEKAKEDLKLVSQAD